MLVSAVNKNSNGAVTDTVTYLNDETGEILKTTDSENRTVTLTYLDETQVWNSAETTLLYSYSSKDEKNNEYVNGTKFTITYSSTDNTEEKTDLTTTETTAFGNLTKTVYSDAFGRVLKEETNNGSTVVMLKEYTYNTNGNYITDQIRTEKITIGDSSYEYKKYTYDNNGNITGIYSKVGDGEEIIVATYEYDELGQLTKDNDTTIAYDNYGNILTKGYSTYSYDDYNWSDKLTSTNGNNVAYDESGNIVEVFGDILVWENGRELSQYSNGNYTINFEYNADGLRTQKEVSVDGFTTIYKYTWCGDKLTHQTWDDKYFHFYYDSNDEIIGVEYYDGETTGYYTYIKNIQGDVIGIVDSEGNLAGEYSYDAWGNYSYDGTDIAYYNPIRYKGYYCDIEISMYYLQSRYYSYVLGRFINADDVDYIGYTGTILSYNIFSYCENSPIANVDENGDTSKKNKNKVYKVAIFYTNEYKSNYTEYAVQLKKDLKKATSVQVKLFAVNYYDEFVKRWNKLGKYDIVFILCHGTRGSLSSFLTHNAIKVAGLKKKNIKSLVLLSCDAARQPFYIDRTKSGDGEPCLAYAMSKLINGYCIGGDGEVVVYSYKGTNELLFRVKKYKQKLVYSKKLKKEVESKGWVMFKYNKKQKISYYNLMNIYDITVKTLIEKLEKHKILN